MPQTITVYCASSRKVHPKYVESASQLAEVLLERKIEIIYGGGAVGLMGTLADKYISRGAKITGVIPEFMVKVEWAHPGVENMLIVHDMHERKKKMIENTDAVIALPGGTGTLEELMEVITLKRLGKFNKPILLLNTDGFYEPLQNFFKKMADEHFIHQSNLEMWKLFDHPNQFWTIYDSFPDFTDYSIDKAQV